METLTRGCVFQVPNVINFLIKNSTHVYVFRTMSYLHHQRWSFIMLYEESAHKNPAMIVVMEMEVFVDKVS